MTVKLNKKDRAKKTSRLVLEPRIVFDAVLPVLAGDAIDAQLQQDTAQTSLPSQSKSVADNVAAMFSERPNEITATSANDQTDERERIEGTLAQTNLTASEIIFIDAAVDGLEQHLLNHPNADVVLLDANSDGVEQIAKVLEGRNDIEAIHILSHGSAGSLALGDTTLTIASMSGQHADDLKTIKNALSKDADILIYGCDFAAGARGKFALNLLSAFTGADVAASNDLTGAADKGGDWDLEREQGQIEAETLTASDWDGLLATTAINPTGGQQADGSDGMLITVSDLGQIQIEYKGNNQLYSPNRTEGTGLYNGIYLRVGSQVVGPDQGAESMSKVPWQSAGAQTLTGSGSEADPWVITTQLYYDAGNTGSYNAAADVLVTVETIYANPNKHLTENITITPPSGNTQDIKYYHAMDTYLNGGDAGGAFSLDTALAENEDTAGDPSFVGVQKGLGTASESLVGFGEVEGSLEFDRYYSARFSGANLYANGIGGATGDIINTWDNNASTDNGLGVQFNFGAITTAQTFSYQIAFDGDTALDLDADNSTATGVDYVTNYNLGDFSGVPIMDVDTTIDNIIGDVNNADVSITNPQAGDTLSIDNSALPPGVTITASSATSISFSGVASETAYTQALQAITFTSSSTDTTARSISVAVYNQLGSTPATATATINMLAGPTVDLNSGTTSVSNTGNLVSNGTFDDNAAAPANWVELGVGAGTNTGASGGYTFSAMAPSLT